MRVDEPIEVVPYRPGWETAALSEIERLADVLRGWPAVIEHIGSTAVPGCAAKPIIDLLVGCRPNDRKALEGTLQAAGYESLGEAEPGRIYLRARSGPTAFNVHIVEREGRLWQDNLTLRDYLRVHPDQRDRYSAAKHELAATAPRLLAYSRLKAPLLADLLDRARAVTRR